MADEELNYSDDELDGLLADVRAEEENEQSDAAKNFDWYNDHPGIVVPEFYDKSHIAKMAGREITDAEFSAFRQWLFWKSGVDEQIWEVVAPLVEHFFDEKGGAA